MIVLVIVEIVVAVLMVVVSYIMVVIPLFFRAHLLPQFQLLHVLRDGRDIAFSVNQGPVEKFYSHMYGTSHFTTPVPLKAMRLWSDWNSQIYNWAKARTQQ